MRAEAHATLVPSLVRGHEVLRHGAWRHHGGQIFGLAEAVGLTRLWGPGVRAALAGLEQGLETNDGAPGDRLEQGLRAARRELRRLHGTLVERLLPDASFLCLSVEGNDLELVGAGDVRAYVHRGGEVKRLTPRERARDALLRGTPFRSRTPLRPGDVVLAGSESSFSQVAVGRVAAALGEAPDTAPAVLADLLTEPAGQAGVGGVAVVLRVR